MLLITFSTFLLRIIMSEGNFDLFARAVNEKKFSHSPGWGVKTSSAQNGGYINSGTPIYGWFNMENPLKSCENRWFRGRNIFGNIQIVRKLWGTSTKYPSPRGRKSLWGQADSQICQAALWGESSTMEKSWVASAETHPPRTGLFGLYSPIDYGYSISVPETLVIGVINQLN